MFRIMTHYLKAYKWQVLALMVFQIAQALLALYLPNLNADIINKGVASGSSSEIYRYGAIMLGCRTVSTTSTASCASRSPACA